MEQNPYHYDVIARAIEVIGDTRKSHPTLEEIAEKVGLSPAHFQRVFSQWAGVSPKRYQQYLTLNHAKDMLANHATVFDTTEEVGLSSSSRLHDLFLTWEAMTPGEYAQKGAGLTIRYAWQDSPYGEMLVMVTDRGICGMAFSSEMGREVSLDDMTSRWPHANYSEDPVAVAEIAGDLVNGKAKLHLIGAPFQIKVWEALLAIPSGSVTTYGDIATKIGNPKAVRAVGTAVGRNPISWLVPCHRALRKTGELGGYHWGLMVKRAMLAREAARFDANVAE
ncbi:MAG: bifunctional helix-turn-helix domain-containing protein/methylated-DNA--[protein]-cysteine S-methyltransferase [Pseudomonadota bacterium]